MGALLPASRKIFSLGLFCDVVLMVLPLNIRFIFNVSLPVSRLGAPDRSREV